MVQFNLNYLKNNYGKYSVKELSNYFNLSTYKLYRIIKKNNIKIKSFFITKICLNCNKKYIVDNKNHKSNTQKFCCNKCSLKYFHKNNPEKRNVYSIKYRTKNRKPKYCKICKKQILNRSYNNECCSENCKKILLRITANKFSAKTFILFIKYKEKIGCKICGYNKCGACLDFHHINPNEKTMRITAGKWYGKSDLIKKEIKKCILLCKNCHYELHYKKENKNGK